MGQMNFPNEIFNRKQAMEKSKDIIHIASPLLQELVNKGIEILTASKEAGKDLPDYSFSLLNLFAHIIEMTDSIEVLISKACFYPLIPNLRSSFEALLAINYILHDPNEYYKRSLAWSLSYIKAEIAKNERNDPTTDRGREYYSKLKKQYNIDPDPSAPGSAAKNNKPLMDFLANPIFNPVEQEYQTKHNNTDNNGKAAIRKVDWHQIYSGRAAGIEGLAIKVEKPADYETLYRMFSEFHHAKNMDRFWGTDENNNPIILGFRNPKDKSDVIQLIEITVKFSWEATCYMVKHFCPDKVETMGLWYEDKIALKLKLLSKLKENIECTES